MITKLIEWIKATIKFIMYDLWRIKDDEQTTKKNILYRILKILYLSAINLFNGKLSMRASSLTYYALFALMPIIVVVIGISKGFGLESLVNEDINDLLPSQGNLIPQLHKLAVNFLERNSSDFLMIVAIILLMWTIINMLSQLESAMNEIWDVKENRNTVKRFTNYFLMILIFPLLLAVSSSISIFIEFAIGKVFETIVFIKPLTKWLLKLLPIITNIFLFTLVYWVFPNTRVKFVNALIGAAVSGTAFYGFQYLYISGQIWVSHYNSLYGSVAALPLLLLYIQFSWMIMLYGAEIAFARQNLRYYDYNSDIDNISDRYKRFFYLLVCSIIVKRFDNNEKALSAANIAQEYRLPIRLVSKSVRKLFNSGIIVKAKFSGHEPEKNVYIPAVDINKLTIACLFSEIDEHGSEDFNIDIDNKYAKEWSAILNEKIAANQFSDNLLVKDI